MFKEVETFSEILAVVVVDTTGLVSMSISIGTSSKDKSSNGLVLFVSGVTCPVTDEVTSIDLTLKFFRVFELSSDESSSNRFLSLIERSGK